MHPCSPHTSAEQQHVFPVAVSVGTPSQGLLLRIARRAICSFSSREAAELVAWAELSSVQFSFLLFVQEVLSHNPAMHLKSLLQDKCKMLCLCATRVVLVRVTCRKCRSRNSHAHQALLGDGSAYSMWSTLHPPKTPAEPLGRPQVPAWHHAQHGACPRTWHRHCYPHGHHSTSQYMRLGNITLCPLHSQQVLVQHAVCGLSQGASFA